ncbi:GNAT family N-acetyltransferase [Edwardsiella tarda]|uniref:GNAT family N-acetyltransferase n=1 Tax=Edwardsiella tarda TaxID=636 RepID=UPI0026706E5E|nr:GNAT family N-acetyltransferase [Edwardsiella tarda]WKS81998.1 GNAT family N-acetyltransferase [Edwardsiella tarda]
MQHTILLAGPELQLIPAHPRFAQALFSLVEQNREHLCHFLSWPHSMAHVDNLTQTLHAQAEAHQAGSARHYVIHYQQHCVGVISLNSIDLQRRCAPIGYWLAQPYQGKGLVSASLQALMRHYVAQREVTRFVIQCISVNLRSNAVARRNGFTLVETRHQACELEGVRYDQNTYLRRFD